VGVRNFPKKLAVINTISTDASICPSTDYDFVGKDGAVREDANCTGS